MGRDGGGAYAQIEARRSREPQAGVFEDTLAAVDAEAAATATLAPAPTPQQAGKIDGALQHRIQQLEQDLHHSEEAVVEQTQMLRQLQRSREQQLNDLRKQLGLEAVELVPDPDEQRATQRNLVEQLRFEFDAQISVVESQGVAASGKLEIARSEVGRLAGVHQKTVANQEALAAAVIKVEEELLLQKAAPLGVSRQANAEMTARLQALQQRVAKAYSLAQAQRKQAEVDTVSEEQAAVANAAATSMAMELDAQLAAVGSTLRARHYEVEALEATVAREREERESLTASMCQD